MVIYVNNIDCPLFFLPIFYIDYHCIRKFLHDLIPKQWMGNNRIHRSGMSSNLL